MLVLSRRLNEKFRFPTFQTSVQILSLSSDSVRLGIDAPPEVTVLREEIPDRVAEWGADAEPEAGRLQRLARLLRQRLQVVRVGLAELRNQLLPVGLSDAEVTLDKLEEDLHLLQGRLDVETATPSLRCPLSDAPPGLIQV
jgi:carbon storage regulator CsrA